MEWTDEETWESKKSRKEQWNRWFAWYPVPIGTIIRDGKTRKVKAWLQFVVRKGRYVGLGWVYEYGKIK